MPPEICASPLSDNHHSDLVSLEEKGRMVGGLRLAPEDSGGDVEDSAPLAPITRVHNHSRSADNTAITPM